MDKLQMLIGNREEIVDLKLLQIQVLLLFIFIKNSIIKLFNILMIFVLKMKKIVMDFNSIKNVIT